MDRALAGGSQAGPRGLSQAPAPGQPCKGEGQGGQQAERSRPSQLSCQTGAANAEPDIGTGLTNYPGAPSAVWGVRVRVSACEGVWEGCGCVCASVTVWGCVGVWLCTWAVCGCVSQSHPLICQRLWLSAYGLSVSPRPEGLCRQPT